MLSGDEFGDRPVGTENQPMMMPASPPSDTRSSSDSMSTMRASPMPWRWPVLRSSARITNTQAPSSPYRPGSNQDTSR